MWTPGFGSLDVEARIWRPGCGSQDLEARIWYPGFGSQDLVAKMMKKHWFLYEKEDFVKKKTHDSRNRFVDIGLENVAVAERAWSTDLRAAVIRGVENVDV